jgi:hypothetical protein
MNITHYKYENGYRPRPAISVDNIPFVIDGNTIGMDPIQKKQLYDEFLVKGINSAYTMRAGLDMLSGNGLFYGKVTVHSEDSPINNTSISPNHTASINGYVEYKFITPNDLPVVINFTKNEPPYFHLY